MSVSRGAGRVVTTLRQAVGLTLEEAATRSGLDPAHLRRIEEGTGYAPDKLLANISGGLAQWAVDDFHTPYRTSRAFKRVQERCDELNNTERAAL